MLALLDFDVEHGRSDRAKFVLRGRRAALVCFRDRSSLAEAQANREAHELGHQEANMMRQRAVHQGRAKMEARRRSSLVVATKPLAAMHTWRLLGRGAFL